MFEVLTELFRRLFNRSPNTENRIQLGTKGSQGELQEDLDTSENADWQKKIDIISSDAPHPLASSVRAFDATLLERSYTQWQFGDWTSLCQLNVELINGHPDRAKLALLAAAGHLQAGQQQEAKRLTYLAQSWGASKELISQILISGVHNSLGRAAAISQQPKRAELHFQSAVAVGSPGADRKLLKKARQDYQLEQLFAINSQKENNRIESCLRDLELKINALQQEKTNLENQRKSKYYTPDGYDAKKYWTDRHTKYKYNMQGVGNKGLTDEENQSMYKLAASEFTLLCNDLEIDFKQVSVLDVGCGNGYYANLLEEQGVARYCGLDIADTLLDSLRNKHPSYTFRQMDITEEIITEKYDLIIMIDVTQHITIQSKFSFAMNNIKQCLNSDGVFIVTSWLNSELKNSFYESYCQI